MEINYPSSESLDIAQEDLNSLVIQTGFATVYQLELNEVPQPSPSSIAILNVTGWCIFPGNPCGGLCVMMAGRDRLGEMLWACDLTATSPQEEVPQWLCASLLVNSSAIGQTDRISIRVAGESYGESK